MKIIGIDVSTWQGKIDWNQVKNSDVDVYKRQFKARPGL